MIRIAVIGGGPAGFMAAISAVENNPDGVAVDIFDKGESLKTILCTGNGRCNLTNETYDFKELASFYPRGEKFLYSVFNRFGVRETIDWFQFHGIELYTQHDNRIFPKSNDANTVRYALIETAQALNINIKNYTAVEKIEYKDNKFIIFTRNNVCQFDKVIISTGGNYKNHDSSGYHFAKVFEHKVTELKQALCALTSIEKWCSRLSGVSIKEAEITALIPDSRNVKARGDFIFTHEGISGPLTFKISSYCAFLNYGYQNPLLLRINFIPNKSVEKLEKEILDELNKNSKKSIINILKDYIPKSLLLELLNSSNIDPEKKASQISKDDRKLIIKFLTSTELNIKSPKPDGEIVTAGGIDLNDINPKTMESKVLHNLYFCGEVLNIDGLTGGFNLQACWSTGFIAGLNASI